jgi:hypothetical protein
MVRADDQAKVAEWISPEFHVDPFHFASSVQIVSPVYQPDMRRIQTEPASEQTMPLGNPN